MPGFLPSIPKGGCWTARHGSTLEPTTRPSSPLPCSGRPTAHIPTSGVLSKPFLGGGSGGPRGGYGGPGYNGGGRAAMQVGAGSRHAWHSRCMEAAGGGHAAA